MKSRWRKLFALLPDKAERKYYEKYFRKEHDNWVRNGSPLPVSNLSKQKVLQQFQQEYHVKTFVETGTYLGDTLYSVYLNFDQLYSIELSHHFFKKAKKRFKSLTKVELLQGDSGEVLKDLVPKLHDRAIFWLDGHYSGGMTAKGVKECPVFEELTSIFKSPFDHFIFIDDARLFTGKADYPTIKKMKDFIKLYKPLYHFSIENDCIRLLPTSV